MILARMIDLDEEALICDLAETYHIYDYKQLSPSKIAVFSIGLRETSRIKMKINNQMIPLETILIAGINDKLSVLLWRQTEDAQKGRNKPKFILDSLFPQSKKDKNEIVFTSGEEFEKARQKILREGGRD